MLVSAKKFYDAKNPTDPFADKKKSKRYDINLNPTLYGCVKASAANKKVTILPK